MPAAEYYVEAMADTDPAFARLVELGIPRNARRDAEWVSENQAVLSAAVQALAD